MVARRGEKVFGGYSSDGERSGLSKAVLLTPVSGSALALYRAKSVCS